MSLGPNTPVPFVYMRVEIIWSPFLPKFWAFTRRAGVNVVNADGVDTIALMADNSVS